MNALPASTEAESVFGIKIVGVWLGSPADEAGIMPGDWLLSVDGKPVFGKSSTVSAKQSDSDEELSKKEELVKTALANAQKNLDEAPGEKVAIEVQRDGKVRTYKVGRADVGAQIKPFMAKNMAAWEEVWATAHKETQKFLEELTAAGQDEKKIDGLFLKLKDIYERFMEPENQANDFLGKQLKASP